MNDDLFFTLLDRAAWTREAACKGASFPVDNDPFFDIDPADPMRAQCEYCVHCPVIERCREEGGDSYGIWGGMTQDERVDFTTRFPNPNVTRARKAWTQHLSKLRRKASGRAARIAYDNRNRTVS